MYILTLNCGSSSAKYQLYDWDEKEALAKGIVERVTIGNSYISHFARGKGTKKIERECPTHREAIDLIINCLLDPKMGAISSIRDIKAVGHRLVHGGEKLTRSVVVNRETIKTAKEVSDLGPLHNPANILGIEAAMELMPDIPHTVSMDTAWHQTMPAHAYMYALPFEWYRKYRVRRYGFHGTSFLYIAKRASVLLGKDPFETNIIGLHIGNGASANAVLKGVSVDTSMGMTPLEGLVMGTRSGDHDPAIDFYMMRKENINPDDMEAILNKKSGMLGITERYVDRRDVIAAREKGEEQADLAVRLEAYRIKKYVGAYTAALGRVDAIVFTAGVGEMSPPIRQMALEGLEGIGIVIDPEKNALSRCRNAETEITAEGSRIKVYVIPTDEELVLTEDAFALMQGTYDVHTNFTYSFQRRDYVNKERAAAFKSDLQKQPDLRDIVARVP
ncbi:MAG TPA: acetate kinase [Spirochaetia bacterium]|nr:acetate kinase [Spirochaetia bacterium]